MPLTFFPPRSACVIRAVNGSLLIHNVNTAQFLCSLHACLLNPSYLGWFQVCFHEMSGFDSRVHTSTQAAIRKWFWTRTLFHQLANQEIKMHALISMSNSIYESILNKHVFKCIISGSSISTLNVLVCLLLLFLFICLGRFSLGHQNLFHYRL